MGRDTGRVGAEDVETDENVGFSILIRLLSCCNFSMVKELKNAEIKKLKEGPLQVFLGDTIGNVSHSQVQREQ